eukprot:365720-Chlamydomonas_euryale.AAC.4
MQQSSFFNSSKQSAQHWKKRIGHGSAGGRRPDCQHGRCLAAWWDARLQQKSFVDMQTALVRTDQVRSLPLPPVMCLLRLWGTSKTLCYMCPGGQQWHAIILKDAMCGKISSMTACLYMDGNG